MSRPLRIERARGWYRLTRRGNERRAIDRDNRDRAHFCELLGRMAARFRVRLHGFVLMDNHYRLILALTEPNLSRTGQWLNVSYSVWFNRRHGRGWGQIRAQVSSTRGRLPGTPIQTPEA